MIKRDKKQKISFNTGRKNILILKSLFQGQNQISEALIIRVQTNTCLKRKDKAYFRVQ